MNQKKNDLLYLAKPNYGGWVTFTVHLLKCLCRERTVRLFKISNKTEQKLRDFGYSIKYQNINNNTCKSLINPIIAAVDSSNYENLKYLYGSSLVIHDPTELKPELINQLDKFKIITIRESVQKYLIGKYNIQSKFIFHPFYQYQTTQEPKNGSVSISRIDFDKNIDIILKANQTLKEPIQIYGFVNRLYEHFKLGKLDFKKYYKGVFPKSFYFVNSILKTAKFVIDMSTIKNDGSGTQYTFLEAINNDCCLILNSRWFVGGIKELKPGYNCLAVKDEKELFEILTKNPDVSEIIKNARKLLINHDLKEI